MYTTGLYFERHTIVSLDSEGLTILNEFLTINIEEIYLQDFLKIMKHFLQILKKIKVRLFLDFVSAIQVSSI